VSPRTIFSPYVRLFAVPGSRTFSFAGWLARFPTPILGLGAVLLVAGETGSYAVAGAVAGTLALAGALVSPVWARAMDRRGQGVVLPWAMAGYLVFGLGFTAAVVLGTPRWSWFVLAALTGACGPNIGSMVRARWAHALDGESRQTAFALESVIDEVVFVLGPPLITLVATLINPPVGFVGGVLTGFAGGMWLSRLRQTEPPVLPADPSAPTGRAGALGRTVLLVLAAYLAVGMVFGAMDVVVVAYAEEEGAAPLAGVALGAYAGGSLVAGLAYGLLRLPYSLAVRYLGCMVIFALATQLLILTDSLTVLPIIAFVAGLAIAPVLVSGMSLVESRVSRSALTEALTWVTTGLIVGVTIGSAGAGAAVDVWGAETAFAVPTFSAALAGLLALLGWPLLRRAPERQPSTLAASAAMIGAEEIGAEEEVR
jgi:MFS family permease